MLETQLRQGTAYRSIRYSTIRKDSHTADPESVIQSRPKRKLIQSTFQNSRTLDLKSYSSQPPQSRINPQRPTYLESFHSLLNSQLKSKERQDGYSNMQISTKFIDFDNKFDRDCSTEFTLLDPFNRPYTYLARQISKTEKQIKTDFEDIRLIRSQLAALRNSTIINLNNIEEQGKRGLQRLRNLLKKNEVKQSERKMKVRREITELYQFDDANRKNQQDLNKRVLNLQSQIFNCHPYELSIQSKIQNQ